MVLFKERLKELRLERGLTQEQLADQLDIPASSIRRLEASDSIPRRDRLLSLSAFFGESIDFLMGNTDIRQRDRREDSDEETNNESADGKLTRERTEYVLRELVKKYNLDLTNPQDAETLEDMIKIVHRNSQK
ncbi:helix-turn-helix domain-containing protein [Paenibacillus agri]|uniref:Helix-turn-helix transcriptional regulator n=1 Tax=Paenibacillus agri TaxID=2744309 RepID=A0A850ETI8_9BACL|nr:helix-turn-helix transcriptional regulator [Paenibacillus agri]NUU62654.1 helix-turn-helix transcriptional regulator [Paenibacillus agri]